MEASKYRRPRLGVAALGVVGLVGLLWAAQAMPGAGTLLRAGALLWFLGLGAYETVWRVDPRRRR